MVTTRRGTQVAPPGDEAPSIVPKDGMRLRSGRQSLTATTSASLRTTRKAAPGSASKKRASEQAELSSMARPKRQRPSNEPDEDDIVDDAIQAMATRTRKRKLRVPLPTTTTMGVRSEPPATTTGGRRLRARRLGRGVNSIEILGEIEPSRAREKRQKKRAARDMARETPEQEEPEEEEPGQRLLEKMTPSLSARRGARQDGELRPIGSPELQTSALRPSTRTQHIYDLLTSDESKAPSPAQSRSRPTGKRPMTSRMLAFQSSGRTLVNDDDVSEDDGPGAPGLPRNVSRPPGRAPASSGRPSTSAPRSRAQSARSRPSLERAQPRLVPNNAEAQVIDDSDDSESPGLLPEPEDSEPESEAGQAFPGIQIRPYTARERTIPVYGDHLNRMSELVGRRGWTGLGQQWNAELQPSATGLISQQSPFRTELGILLFWAVSDLRDLLGTIPNAQDLAAQSKGINDHRESLHEAMSEVHCLVRKIARRWASSAVASDNDRARAKFHKALVQDLTTHVIPMMVMLLRAAFRLGVTEPDGTARATIPDEAVYTWTTVQVLMTSLGWLSSLYRVVKPPAESPGQQRHQQPRRDDPGDVAQNRAKLGVAVRKWGQQIRVEVDAFNEQADLDRDRAEKKRRDAEIRRQRQMEAEREIAAAKWQEEAWLKSMQEIKNKPRPLAEQFRLWDENVARNHAAPAPAPAPAPVPPLQAQGSYPAASSRPQTQAPPRAPSSAPSWARSVSAAPPAARGQHQARVETHRALRRDPSPDLASSPGRDLDGAHRAVPDLPPWPANVPRWNNDDIDEFLEEISRPDREQDYLEVCSEVLNRPMEEVLAVKEWLSKAGRYESPVRSTP
ncbi:hypothetical protein VTJ83DRAFT_5411 [Remersonia thermophila]|uniref:Uncharacterized protein n=1 Tax=Remersonia thermophila TaxID=72144 RepID=A0ABR4D7P2_9PEZI